jgi:hypothetical protein
MTAQVMRSVAHGIRDSLRVVRRADSNETGMLLLTTAIMLTVWLAIKPII